MASGGPARRGARCAGATPARQAGGSCASCSGSTAALRVYCSPTSSGVTRRRTGKWVANLFMHCRYHTNTQEKREARTQAFAAWERVTCAPMPGRLASPREFFILASHVFVRLHINNVTVPYTFRLVLELLFPCVALLPIASIQ